MGWLENKRRLGGLLAGISVALLMPSARGFAHGAHGHKNLKVLVDDHHAIDAGMKRLAQGLGVDCKGCHVKGKFDSDQVPAKQVARQFFAATVGEPDPQKREAALAPVLGALEIAAPKDPAALWSAIDSWRRR
jgi:hypothetical protein